MDEIIKQLEGILREAAGGIKERAETGLRIAKKLKALFDRANGSCLYDNWEVFQKEFEGRKGNDG